MKHPNERVAHLLEKLASVKLPTIDLSLDRVSRLLTVLGNPEDKLPPVVHVAGTNGKGSLVAYLTAILQAAGYRVHRYISPYLVRFNEQIMLANHEIDDEFLIHLLSRVAEQSEIYPVTFFEAATVAGFLGFAEIPADVVLLETGLGGRLDATNMVKRPALTAITPISLDHMEFLGDTVAKIAAEKAGIIKYHVPCVVGPQVVDAFNIIERSASKNNSPLYAYNQHWKAFTREGGFHYSSEAREADFPPPSLPGCHQILNAATAIACVDRLTSFSIRDENIRQGLAQSFWPARLQRLTEGALANLMPHGCELWLDGGHNVAAAEVLADWSLRQAKPVHVLCGMLRNKDIRGFLKTLSPRVVSITTLPIEGQALSGSPEEIFSIGQAIDVKTDMATDAKSAIQGIVNNQKKDLIILICGSLYLAGNILLQNSQKA